MADTNPRDAGRACVITIPPAQVEFLRCAFAGCKLGREDDLRTHPDHPNAEKWRDEAAAYGRLLDGLDAGEVVSDDDVRRLVRELADANDREEEYERVCFEHAALLGLRVQIGAGR